MKTTINIAIVLASLALFACDKPEDAKPTEPATPAATAPAPNTLTPNTPTNTATTAGTQAKAGDGVTIADTDLVTSADYEAEAEKAITNKNYKTEITSLEAEIGKQ
jgi:hypothetical protein